MSTDPDQNFTVLVVCTGNVCRSPAAERLLSDRLRDVDGLTVHSAGLAALDSQPVQEPMARLLEAQAVSTAGFSAKTLRRPMADSADLILTATRRHRAGVVELAPAKVRCAFTLREFARLAQVVDPHRLAEVAGPTASPADRLAALVPLAAAGRQQVPAELDDIIDPYRRSDAVYQEAFAHIVSAVDSIAQAAGGSPLPASQ